MCSTAGTWQAPEGSAENANDWTVGTELDVPPSLGEIARASLGRQPEILSFLASRFGPYPFEVSGAIITSFPLDFAIETETRPIYPRILRRGRGRRAHRRA
jgi:hypothetical protein